MKTTLTEKQTKAADKREQLKALSNSLKSTLKLIQDMSFEKVTMNDLIIKHYKQTNGVTELNTFEEWKKKGYRVKKGESSFLVWGRPTASTRSRELAKANDIEEENAKKDFFPVCHLFDIKQVQPINK